MSGMKSNQLIDFLEKRRQEIYKDERSKLKEYDELLMKYGVVRGYDGVTYSDLQGNGKGI